MVTVTDFDGFKTELDKLMGYKPLLLAPGLGAGGGGGSIISFAGEQ